MEIAILGAKGFLGSVLFDYFQDKTEYNITGITRANYAHNIGKKFDVFINANGNSKRYWANNNIIEDFKISTISVYNNFYDFKIKYYIYISSADVYDDHEDLLKIKESATIDFPSLCPYGFHKYLSELIIKRHADDYLILRCSNIIGKNLKKGVIKDMMESNPLYIRGNSEIQFISAFEIAKIISMFLNNDIKNEIFNVGGIGTISIHELGNRLHKKLYFHPNIRKQIYEMNVDKLNKIFPLKKTEYYIKEIFPGKGGEIK